MSRYDFLKVGKGKNPKRRTGVKPHPLMRPREKPSDDKQFRELMHERPTISYINAAPIHKPIRDKQGEEYLHVSDVMGKCLRRYLIAQALDIRLTEDPEWPSQSLTYAQGHAIEDFVCRSAVMRSPHKVWGKWSCPCEATQYQGVHRNKKQTIQCDRCGHTPNRYLGWTIWDKEHGLVGNVDLLFHFTGGYKHITEVKSIQRKDWEQLRATPNPNHALQGSMYWDMLRRQGKKLTDKVSILYVCKEMMRQSPYKEFVIDPRASRQQQAIQLLYDAADEYHASRQAIDGIEIPMIPDKHRECSSPTTYRAKNCECLIPCFQKYL